MSGAQVDVLVVGGGMVGVCMALAAARVGCSVALLELRPPKPDADHRDDLRVSAISPSSQRLLENLGIWGSLNATDCCAYEAMSVRDALGNGRIGFDCADYAQPSLGHIVFNQAIVSSAWQRVHSASLISPIEGVGVHAFKRVASHMSVSLDDGREIDATLVIGADGVNSRVRELAGIRTCGWQYPQHAVVATVRHADPHQRVARQVFLDDGPLAFLPLGDGRSSIVWSTTPRHAEALTGMAEGEFLAALEAAMEGELGAMQQVGARASFALGLRHALDYVQPRLALIGDAAHQIHPLAGQGVNLGFVDVAVLSDIIKQARQASRDVGEHGILRRYERRRKSENLPVMAGMDLIQRLFSRHAEPVNQIRSLGLSAADRLTPLKRLFAQQAMGFSGDAPDLLR
ncbi:MAG TPA: 2-octaprenyl-3-methyl-6-methoxy-1,4-benzoquinol hydroxylase [Chromatiaceae bacterium]|jgi:2-octaprenylphenol hydroxylase|nr:2-octaprenyl-3-methyl-6-methoxy-1,4-benzoquinol hydroxylase [Chromatiaceae bacterium]HIB84447.1 2-octaprenyl-3-methyl-6-methoxy-1,4-benzoquinol hydroxylase [Chromatiaceae bacterium]